jgi:hypothetical protein
MDLWSDPDRKAYMAVTAHWMESMQDQQSLSLRIDLIGFVYIPGAHTGQHLAEIFLWILKRVNIVDKVSYIFLYNKICIYIFL